MKAKTQYCCSHSIIRILRFLSEGCLKEGQKLLLVCYDSGDIAEFLLLQDTLSFSGEAVAMGVSLCLQQCLMCVKVAFTRMFLSRALHCYYGSSAIHGLSVVLLFPTYLNKQQGKTVAVRKCNSTPVRKRFYAFTSFSCNVVEVYLLCL